MSYVSREDAKTIKESVPGLHPLKRILPFELTFNCGTSARDPRVDLLAAAQVGLQRALCDSEPESHEVARTLNICWFEDGPGAKLYDHPMRGSMQRYRCIVDEGGGNLYWLSQPQIG
jgi:hypothetical protein